MSKNLIVAYRIRLLTAGVAGVAFYGVDCAVFDLFDDADMVGNAVLTAFVGEVPIEEDDITGAGRVGVILPLFTGPQHREPSETAEKVVFFLRYSGLCIDFELYFLQIVHICAQLSRQKQRYAPF